MSDTINGCARVREEITVEMLELFHERLGICFVGNDGRFSAQLPARVVG